MFLFAAPPQDDLDIPTWHEIRHAWHHDILSFVRQDGPRLVSIVVYSFVLLRVILFFVNRMKRLADRQSATNPQRANELRTVASILRATTYGIVSFVALVQVLLLFGIHTESLLASAGVVGVGIGLGAQSLFKDMLNGIFILIENQYNVGDSVKIASLTGTVEDLSLRLTTLRDGDGTLYFIPNSQVATVSNLSRDFAVGTLNIVVDASADPDKVISLLRATAKEVRDEPSFQSVTGNPVVPGIDTINGRAVTYPVSIRVSIGQKDNLLRELRRRILQAFEANSIPLGTDPANLLLARKPDPTAPPAQQPLTSA